MDLITVRELYRNKEDYLDKTITVGGWYAASEMPRRLALLY